MSPFDRSIVHLKILFVTDAYKPQASGPVYSVEMLSHALVRMGHKVYIAGPGKSLKSKVYEHRGNLKVYGISSVRAPIYPDLWIPVPGLVSLELEKIVEVIKPDIIHVQDHFLLGSAALALAKKKSLPVVGTNHFMPENFLHYIPMPGKLKEQIIKIAWKQFAHQYNQLSYVTAPTQIAVDVIKKVGLKNNIEAISNGIDLSRFTPKNKGGYLKEKYRIPNKKILLFVGRIDPEKRLDMVVRAFMKAREKMDLHLVIAGKGGYQRDLTAIVEELGAKPYVTMTGFVADSDLPKLYRVADAFVMASDAELQSIATMEAMASGLPIIAARAVALPLLVKNNVNGYLFRANDEKELVDSILKMFTSEKRRVAMGRQSLRIIKAHDVMKSARKMVKIYKEALVAPAEIKAAPGGVMSKVRKSKGFEKLKEQLGPYRGEDKENF
ncbi:glycosyltransferase [Candidatus Curtissbacteria bacterium]|nr:glycosyltransferase [Candidatus Curtissbacteria bacterium]